MRRTYRFALLAVAALATLGFASSAFASFAPKLVVSSNGSSGGPVRLGVVAQNADDPTARVQIYIPAGYQVATPAAGTKLGTVTATASAADLGGAVLPLTGELDAIRAERHGSRAVRRRRRADVGPASDCRGPDARHPAVRRCERACRGGRGLPDEARRLPAPAGRARRHAGACDVRREAPLGSVRVSAITRAGHGRRLPLDVAVDAVQPGQGHRERRGNGRDTGDSPHPDPGEADRDEEEARHATHGSRVTGRRSGSRSSARRSSSRRR